MTDEQIAKLGTIVYKLEDLEARGKLDRETFQKYFADAKKIVGRQTDALEAIILFAEPDWVPLG